MKRISFLRLLVSLMLALPCQGLELGRTNYTISFYDQEGDTFTEASSVTIYDVGTSNASTVYTSKGGSTTVTNPIVDPNVLEYGTITFYGAAPYYDIQIASSTYAGVVKRSYVRPTKHKIIYPLAESVGNVSAGTITATGAVSFEGNVTLGNNVTDNITVTGAIQGANALYFDGATNNTIETIFAITDPCSSDKTITFPASTGTVMLSTAGADLAYGLFQSGQDLKYEGITANDYESMIRFHSDAAADYILSIPSDSGYAIVSITDLQGAHGIWTGNSSFIFEGATPDAYETTLVVADPTSSSKTITLPNATGTVMLSTLATNAPDVASSVTGGTNQLIFEGSGVDTYEAIITATNPTADIVWTLPDAGAMTVSFMSSTLATNMPGVANSVWGGTNQLIFEGGTADAYSTILTCTQATSSSKTITLPNVTGTVLLDTSAIRTGQQYVQTIGYCKVGATAGWLVPAAADAAHVAALPASQTNSTLIIPINIPLKVGWTITAWTINGQIQSGGNTAVLNAKLYEHVEATAGFSNAAIGSGMTTLTKTGQYKVVDGEASLTEVVALGDSYYLLVTGTTAATTDIEICGITVTVSEL